MQKPLIFILHVIQDSPLFQQFKKHLESFVAKGHIELRDLENIRAGTSKISFIKESLEAADMVVPLLSADFFNDSEMRTLFEWAQKKRKQKGVQLVPILLKSCLWKFEVGGIQILPKDEKPIYQHPYPDFTYSNIAQELLQLLHINYDSVLKSSHIPELFLQYETTISKLQLLPYPFSEAFILQLISPIEWKQMKIRRDLIEKIEDRWQIHKDLQSDLETAFHINTKNLKQFAQDCHSAHHEDLPVTDRINILSVLLDYAEKFKINKLYLRSIFEILQDIDVLEPKQQVKIQPILLKVEKQIEKEEVSDAIRTKVYQKLANDFVKLNFQLEKAIQFAEKALLLIKKREGEESIEVANCMETIGIIYRKKKKLSKVIELYNKALYIKKAKLPKYHFDLAILYWRIANPYIEQNLLEEAEKYLGNALEIYSNLLDSQKRPRFLAAIYNNLIQLYQLKQDYESAKYFCEKAIVLKQKLFGTDHPQTAITYTQRANSYYFIGDYDKALQDYEYVKDIHLKNQGENHSYTISALSNLATTYKAKGMYQKANTLFQQVLAHLENHTHIEAFILYAEVGKYYLALKDYDQAKHYFNLSLEQNQVQFGEESNETAHYFHNMGLIYREQHLSLDALELFETSLALKIEALGNDNLFVAETLYEIGKIKKQLKSYGDALDFFEETLHTRKNKRANNDKIVEVVEQIAEIHYLQQDYLLSIAHYEEALTIYQESLKSTEKTITYAHLINVYIKAEKIKTSKFMEYIHKFLELLKIHNSANTTLRNKVIPIFEQKHTFTEKLAKEILQLVPVSDKSDFKTFMQQLGFLLASNQEKIEKEEFKLPTKKIPSNQTTRIKDLLEKIRRDN